MPYSSGSCVHAIFNPRIWKISGIVPAALRFQDVVSFVSVVIQQGFQLHVVMVCICLGTDEGAIEMYTYFLEQKMYQVIHDHHHHHQFI